MTMRRMFWFAVTCCCAFGITAYGAEYPADVKVKGGEYCSLDEFAARCPEDHVIQMLNASFGRMRIGKCIDKDPGCDVDALPVLHRSCSGLMRCRVQVSSIDRQLKNVTSLHCSKEHRLHLEAYYRCIPVILERDQICQTPKEGSAPSPIHVSKAEGFLASIVTKRTAKGSNSCPWRLRGLPGQTIQISLLDTYVGVSPVEGVCQIYAYIKEGSLSGSGSKLMDCGYDSLGHVFSSLSETVDVIMIDNEEDRNFVLHFKAIGCPDIQPEGGASVLRTGNRTRIVCDDDTWILDCVGNEWIGEKSDCNLQGAGRTGSLFPWPKEWGQELTIVLIMAVAVIIAVVIVVVGVCIVRRRAAHDFQPVSQNGGEYGVYDLQGPVFPGKYYYPTLPAMAGGPCAGDGSCLVGHYMTTMERRLVAPSNGVVAPPGGTLPSRGVVLLRQEDIGSCCSCPMHAGSGRPDRPDRLAAVDPSGWQTFPIRRPEHVYHSPGLERRLRDVNWPVDPPYYHELDPDEVRKQLMEEGNGTETTAVPGAARPPPPPNIPIPPIPQEAEVDSGISADTLPPPSSPISPHSSDAETPN